MLIETKILLWIVASYLIGSISPSYILGKLLKGIDIRKKGTRNAGTLNALKVLGVGHGILTALIDISKGAVVVLGAILIGLPEIFVYVSGIMATIGHRYPFYMQFRGGIGVAALIGVLGAVTYFYTELSYAKWFIAIMIIAYIINKTYRTLKHQKSTDF